MEADIHDDSFRHTLALRKPYVKWNAIRLPASY
jgi:hypothetical protein